MKLKQLEEMIKRIYKEEIDPKATASANSLLLMDKLRKNPQFMEMLQQIDLPTDKYKAIQKFAALLGIPEERFNDFCSQQRNITNEARLNEDPISTLPWDKNSVNKYLKSMKLGTINIEWKTPVMGYADSDWYGKIKFLIKKNSNPANELELSFKTSTLVHDFWNSRERKLSIDKFMYSGNNDYDNRLNITIKS